MIKIINASSTGKTRELLTKCNGKGIFVCAHPERVVIKCKAYGVMPP